jgi:hypothetical protein
LTAELVEPKKGPFEEVREGREGSSKDVEKVEAHTLRLLAGKPKKRLKRQARGLGAVEGVPKTASEAAVFCHLSQVRRLKM